MLFQKFITKLCATGALTCVVFTGYSAQFAHADVTLKVGDVAPAFDLPGTDGQQHKLADFKNNAWVVLAWFPKAYTSGCTIECKSLAENGHLIRKFNASYYMISVDPLVDNQGFAEQEQADFPLLSDVSKAVAKAYGVLSERGYAKRHTFYIDDSGKIVAIDRSVRPATSAEDMAATLARLGAPPKSNASPVAAPPVIVGASLAFLGAPLTN